MYSKGSTGKVYQCSAYGGKGHTQERCWSVVGYPRWHPKNPAYIANPSSKPPLPARARWSSNTRTSNFKSANAVNTAPVSESPSDSSLFTPQQLSQLAQLMQMSNLQPTPAAEDCLETPFSGMITCCTAIATSEDWIIDSGASNHMTPHLHNIDSPTVFTTSTCINMPTGATAKITHTGTTKLSNGLSLNNVLCVPFFKHNLLSVKKLIKHNNCEVSFKPSYCTIVDKLSQKLLAVGEAKHGLYYLVHTNDPLLWLQTHTSVQCLYSQAGVGNDSITLRHHRLGHTPQSKLQLIPSIPNTKTSQICVTCPMAKFHNLPFSLSESQASVQFELIHIDTKGPYKVPTQGNKKYFLTISG